MKKAIISYTIQSTVDVKIPLTDKEIEQIINDEIDNDLHKKIDRAVAIAVLRADHTQAFDERRIYQYFDEDKNKLGQEIMLV